MRTRQPVTYNNPSHPFNGMPMHIFEQIGERGVSGYNYYFDHFHGIDVATLATVTTGRWIITESNTGTIDILDSNTYGILRLQCDTNAGDNVNMQLHGSSFKYVVGKRLWCAARLRLEDFDQDAMIFGLVIEGVTDFINAHPGDGFFFHKAGTDTDLDFEIRKDGTSTDVTNAGGTLVNDQYMVIGFYVDVAGNVTPFQAQNGAALAFGTTTAAGGANICDDEDLTITIGVETADGGGDYMDVDWVFACQER